MACNTSVHPSTGFTPLYFMFGKQAKLPVNVVYGSMPTQSHPHPEYVRQLEETLQGAFQNVRKKLGTAAERVNELYNQRVH